VLKKLGLVSIGVTAGLMAAAPLASASESHHDAGPDCNVTSHAEGGNNYGVQRCNRIGQGNGEHNVFNGVELPGLPAPALPELPDLSGIGSGLPTNVVVPGV
jgi:hypothetical protein